MATWKWVFLCIVTACHGNRKLEIQETPVPMWSCTFEYGLCTWYQAKDDGFDWERYQAAGRPFSQFPERDHTTDKRGHYLLAQSSTGQNGHTAKLISQTLIPTTTHEPCEMKMYIQKTSFLQQEKIDVNVVTQNRTISKYSSTSRYRRWTEVAIKIEESENFEIEIVANLSDSFNYIALDDILFSKGCKTLAKANVYIPDTTKENFAGYNFPTGQISAHLKNGTHIKVCSHRPSFSGKFVCSSFGSTALSFARLAPAPAHAALACQNNPSSYHDCDIVTNETCKSVLLVQCSEVYKVTCPSISTMTCTSAVGDTPSCYTKDDICDSENNCPGGEDEIDCLQYSGCRFENSLCDWSSTKQGTVQWKLSGSSHQIPSRNRTVVNSSFIYMDIPKHEDLTGTAVLKSGRHLQGNVSYLCKMRFYYYTQRYRQSKLSVLLTTNKHSTEVWKVERVSSTGWQKVNLELKPGKDIYQVIIKGSHTVRNSNDMGIAIDDISFTPECKFIEEQDLYGIPKSHQFKCKSGEHILKTQVCDRKYHCHDGSDETNCTLRENDCDFEKHLCKWYTPHDSSHEIVFTRRSGQTPSTDTGPVGGHRLTGGHGGYYVYAEATGQRRGDIAELQSPLMAKPISGSCTVRWFYNMYSGYRWNDGSLTVYIWYKKSGRKEYVWTGRRWSSRDWIYASVVLTPTDIYQVVFRSRRGFSFASDVALDDITFSEECYETRGLSTPNPMTITPPPLGVVQACSGVTGTFYNGTASSGNIFTPNYPNNYGRGLFCQWTIRVETGFRIKISFQHFETEFGYDRVELSTNTRSGYFSRMSGHLYPTSAVSPGDLLYVVFRSDSSVEKKGVFMLYEKTTEPSLIPVTQVYTVPPTTPSLEPQIVTSSWCRYGLSRNYGGKEQVWYIASPNFPIGYRNLETCIWNVVVPNANHTVFQFVHLDTESRYDTVEIDARQVTIFGSPNKYSGRRLQKSLLLSGNTARITFRSDQDTTYSGFNLTIAAYPGCHEFSNKLKAVYDSVLPKDKVDQCIDNCKKKQYAKAVVRPGVGTTIRCYCTSEDPALIQLPLMPPSRCMLCHGGTWQRCGSNSYVSLYNSGFTPSPTTVTPHTRPTFITKGFCRTGSRFSSGGGNDLYYLTSPLYPRNYPNNEQCQWTVFLPNANRLALRFTGFLTEKPWDKVTIYDGSTMSRKLGEYAGYLKFELIVTSGKYAVISFSTSLVQTYGGFNLSIASYPACYKSDAMRDYTIKFDSQSGSSSKVKLCISYCKNDGYKYAAYGRRYSTYYSCYCGRVDPEAYGHQRVRTNMCLKVGDDHDYSHGGIRTFSLYTTAISVNDASAGEAGKTKDGISRGALTGVLVGLFILLFAVMFAFYMYKRSNGCKKNRQEPGPPPRQEQRQRRTSRGNVIENYSNNTQIVMPTVAYYVNRGYQDEPPSYNEALTGPTIVFNGIFAPTSLAPIDAPDIPPPTFAEAIAQGATSPTAPRTGSTLSIRVAAADQGAEAAGGVSHDPLPPKPDQQVVDTSAAAAATEAAPAYTPAPAGQRFTGLARPAVALPPIETASSRPPRYESIHRDSGRSTPQEDGQLRRIPTTVLPPIRRSNQRQSWDT